MKKIIPFLLLLPFLFLSCGNPKLEKENKELKEKISKLEKKVEVLSRTPEWFFKEFVNLKLEAELTKTKFNFENTIEKGKLFLTNYPTDKRIKKVKQLLYKLKKSYKKSIAILKYKITERKDISYRSKSHMIYRVVVKVNRLPSENILKNTAEHIWKIRKYSWDEFTVFIYLPGMGTSGGAYGIAEFNSYGFTEFRINKTSLYFTKWEKYIKKK